jgi:predicted phage terminase large subunit-like protein
VHVHSAHDPALRQHKVSGPLLDRIDIHIAVPAVQYKELRGGASAEGSAEIRTRVLAARERQHTRFAALPGSDGRPTQPARINGTARSASRAIFSNSQMNTQQIRTHCELSSDAERLLERAMQQQGLSARAHDRILKVARTIADLAAEQDIYDAPPQTDKVMRLHSQTAKSERGKVILPNSAPWRAEYERELTAFPGSKFDDQVDSTTQALDYLSQHSSMADMWIKLGQR